MRSPPMPAVWSANRPSFGAQWLALARWRKFMASPAKLRLMTRQARATAALVPVALET
ncbi:hypothetical protein D9M70_655140 [compost metagenome]